MARGFGTEEKKGSSGAPGKRSNRRARGITPLRKQIKPLTQQYKQASLEEKEGIKDLTTKRQGQLRRFTNTQQVHQNLAG